MDEQTAALLGKLAAKLGTTSEYLWGVLLKQAPIQAWIMAAEYALTIIVIAAIWKCRKPIGEWLKNAADGDAEPVVVIGGIVFVVVAIIWLIACVFCFPEMVTGFLNPEYWALKEILSSVRSK